jgi:hypothetical protein
MSAPAITRRPPPPPYFPLDLAHTPRRIFLEGLCILFFGTVVLHLAILFFFLLMLLIRVSIITWRDELAWDMVDSVSSVLLLLLISGGFLSMFKEECDDLFGP